MRILRLDFGGEIGTIDLHPFVSVLHDYAPAQAEELLAAVQSLVCGSGDGVHGLVEHEGHLIELGIGAPVGPLTTEDMIVRVDAFAAGPDADPAALVGELDKIRRQAQIDAVYVEEIRADLKPAVAAQVHRLQEDVDRLVNGGESEIEITIHRLRAALAELAEIPPVLREIPDEVADLIGAWDDYVISREAAQPRIDELTQTITRADAGLGRAQQELLDAKDSSKPVVLSREDEARLEQLAESGLDRRGRNAKTLNSEEQAEMDRLLAKVGMTTYTGYAMYRLNPTPSAEKMEELALATQRVDAAQAELEQSRAALEIDPTAVALSDEFDAVKAKAREHLGPMLPSDLGNALSKLVVESDNPDYFDGLGSLFALATEEEVPFPDGIEPAQIPESVTHWVDHQEAQLDSGPVIDEEKLLSDLLNSESELDRHVRAMARIDQLEAKAADSAEAVRELEARIVRVENGESVSAEGAISNIVPLIEKLGRENEGSVPVVLEGDFVDLGENELVELLDQLESVAQRHQLILVTGRETAAAWATGAGLRRAMLSQPAAPEQTHQLTD